MFTAIRNVVPSHLCDSELFDFKNVDLTTGVVNGGDIAFDQESVTTSDSANTQKAKFDRGATPVQIIDLS